MSLLRRRLAASCTHEPLRRSMLSTLFTTLLAFLQVGSPSLIYCALKIQAKPCRVLLCDLAERVSDKLHGWY